MIIKSCFIIIIYACFYMWLTSISLWMQSGLVWNYQPPFNWLVSFLELLSQLGCITVMYVCTVVAARYKLLSYWVIKRGNLSIKTISNPPFSSKCLYQVRNMPFFSPLVPLIWYGFILSLFIDFTFWICVGVRYFFLLESSVF